MSLKWSKAVLAKSHHKQNDAVPPSSCDAMPCCLSHNVLIKLILVRMLFITTFCNVMVTNQLSWRTLANVRLAQPIDSTRISAL